ncbi:MAG: P27 family phage terminase small subunit [Desulfobacterales bacterium]
MANKRIPDNVHLLKRTHQKCRHGDPKSKPKVKSKLPVMPRWLPVKAKAEWKSICKELKDAKILTGADRTILTQYCLLVSELATEKADFQAAKHTQLRLCCVELGLTPSARSRITVPKDDDDDF